MFAIDPQDMLDIPDFDHTDYDLDDVVATMEFDEIELDE